MKRQGQLVRWESARGFGFIRSPDISADVFVHQRDFVDRSIAPKVGMALQFDEIHVGGKGPRAIAVGMLEAMPRRPASRQRSASTPARRRGATAATASSSAVPFIVSIVGYAAVMGYGISTHRIPLVGLGLPLLVSLLTFLVYGVDKHAAETGRWRISEKSLHLLSLAGGWPGAWWAQRMFRHKMRKASFMTIYWGTVVVHLLAVTAWAGGFLPARLATL